MGNNYAKSHNFCTTFTVCEMYGSFFFNSVRYKQRNKQMDINIKLAKDHLLGTKTSSCSLVQELADGLTIHAKHSFKTNLVSKDKNVANTIKMKTRTMTKALCTFASLH